MKIFILISLVFSGLSPHIDKDVKDTESTNIVNISGKIFDLSTGEALTGATITVLDSETATLSGFDGDFLIAIPEKDSYSLRIEFVSYQKKIIRNITIENLQDLQIGLMESKDVNFSGSGLFNTNS